jgi:hypothetical protein
MHVPGGARYFLLVLPLLTWLIQGAAGPALVGLPVTWAASDLAGAARGWVRRLRRSDGLSRIVQAAAGADVELSDAEFTAVRKLLEQESTWVEAGRGTVEDLAVLIASCLPGRTGDSSLAAGRAIAGGLLEFAIRDLEPEWFRQVLFARLERMQADQASALDQAMLGVHADLAALFAIRDVADEDRFESLTGQLARALERVAPGPADQAEVAVYLATLIRWLNTDPWPQDTRFGGQTLTPARIERKLRIASSSNGDNDDRDADDLGRRCVRLVVLSGPGSGKTWLARRTARLCAEAALEALAAGTGLEEVELPLYTTCARLAAVPPGDNIRRAVVSTALGHLPDLGGSRVSDALRKMFEERHAPTLLVADSLDEAHGADDRIRQADSLPAVWRIVLTSRPASWNRQLNIPGSDQTRLVGVLQPLRYPGDVEPFITRWFNGRPASAAALVGQLRNRPALQQAATVPLVLAFYCIIGGDAPLPGRHADLYAKVIRRMLTGRWRGGGDRDPDLDECLGILRDWAWSAAASNPLSGVGAWEDEFPARRPSVSRDDRDALDHVATPLGPADADTGETRRRFVHRSIREYLVAEHISLRMSAAEAARELLNHLWYDPDWEYAAPAALAMHPQRDQILRDLTCRATGGSPSYPAVAAADGCWEIRRFLAAVALESGESDWSPEAAKMIGRAMQDLVTSGPYDLKQAGASHWPTSNRLIIRSLLDGDTGPGRNRSLTDVAARLAVTDDDRAQVRQPLLGLLADEKNPERACQLADTITRLHPAAEDRARAREALFRLLAAETEPGMTEELASAVAGLTETDEDRTQARGALVGLLGGRTIPESAQALADTVARLTVGDEDRAQACSALVGLLAAETKPQAARQLANAIAILDPAASDRARALEVLLGLLSTQTDLREAQWLAGGIAKLNPSAADQARTREALLGLLTSAVLPYIAPELVNVLDQLSATGDDWAQVREALLGLLDAAPDSYQASALANEIAKLNPADADQARAREKLLSLLDAQADIFSARSLAAAIAALSPPGEDRARAQKALLRQLASEPGWAEWVLNAIVKLAPTGQEQVQVREALLGLLISGVEPGIAPELVNALRQLTPTDQDRVQAQEALLDLLTSGVEPYIFPELVNALGRLTATGQNQAQVREALLDLLITQADPERAWELADAITRLRLAVEDRARARAAISTVLAAGSNTNNYWDSRLIHAIPCLAVTNEERVQASGALLGLLLDETDPVRAHDLASVLAELNPTAEDEARAREALLLLLATEAIPLLSRRLQLAVAELSPTLADLDSSDKWACPPILPLLTAVRQNSALGAWLAALPLIARWPWPRRA